MFIVLKNNKLPADALSWRCFQVIQLRLYPRSAASPLDSLRSVCILLLGDSNTTDNTSLEPRPRAFMQVLILTHEELPQQAVSGQGMKLCLVYTNFLSCITGWILFLFWELLRAPWPVKHHSCTTSLQAGKQHPPQVLSSLPTDTAWKY